MEEYKKINDILKDVCCTKEKDILNRTYKVNNLNMRALAWILMDIGKVKKEDLENNIYIATIPGGIAKMNQAVFVIELSEDSLKVAVHAEEGLIKQRTCKGALRDFEIHISKYTNDISSSNTTNPNNRKFFLMGLALLLCTVVVLGILRQKKEKTLAVNTDSYKETTSVINKEDGKEDLINKEVSDNYIMTLKEYNHLVDKYNLIVDGLSERKLIDDNTKIELRKSDEESLTRDVDETKRLINQLSDNLDKLNDEYVNTSISGFNSAVELYNEQVRRYNTIVERISNYNLSVKSTNKTENTLISNDSYNENWERPEVCLSEIDNIIKSTDQIKSEINTIIFDTGNNLIRDYNLVVGDYNEVIKSAVVTYISEVPNKYDLKKELTISDIREKTDDELFDLLDGLKENNVQVVRNYLVVNQIIAPEERWVKERLSKVSYITGIEAVSKSNDPNGLLGKEGGYTACIYFKVGGLIVKDIPGDSIVEKGTDAGGAVEVYKTSEDALRRCDYLSQFDGTVLYTGSYTVVGTMVIRTSYKLNDKQQIMVTDEIIKKMTEIED